MGQSDPTVALTRAAPSGTNLPEILQADIFHGDYLDWRSSVVFGCFLGFGLFWLAVVSAKRPKLFVSTVRLAHLHAILSL